MVYFPSYEDKEYPDREYMWSILSTLKRDATEFLVTEAREKRSVENKANTDDLIEICPQILKEITDVASQKCKTHLYSLLLTLNIGHKKGVTPFLLRKGAVLKRSRKKAKEFEATLGVLDEVDGIHSSQNDEDNAKYQQKYGSSYYNTIEMIDEEEKMPDHKSQAKTRKK